MPPEAGRHDETGLRNRIKPLRAERRLTQAALAEACGVSRKTINTVERGRFVPSVVLAMRIAEALGAEVREVFTLEGEERET